MPLLKAVNLGKFHQLIYKKEMQAPENEDLCGCSPGGPEFDSQHHEAAHNHL